MNTGEDTRMPIALVSVSDKNGIERFCEGLVELGWSIVSTGGTRAALIEAGRIGESPPWRGDLEEALARLGG